MRVLQVILVGLMAVFAVGANAQAPANNNPCNAEPLIVSAACNFTQYTNVNATATTGVPAPGCANYVDDDVWFSAVVPATGAIIFDSNTGTMVDGGMAVYTGACGSLSLLDCDDDGSVNGNMPTLTVAGLTPGDVIYIRFWGYSGSTGTFSICAQTYPPPPPPPNDNPCNATPLTVGAACNFITSTNLNATPSAGVPAPGCASYAGGDVWFSAVVPASGAIIFDSDNGTLNYGGMAIYTGACGSLALVACDYAGSAMPRCRRFLRQGLRRAPPFTSASGRRAIHITAPFPFARRNSYRHPTTIHATPRRSRLAHPATILHPPT